MDDPKHLPSSLDPNDDIALHLLVETAVFDSSNYEALSHEEVDNLKKEQTVLIGRIEALRRKLLLETKVRDAAQSLSRLQSHKQNEVLTSSTTELSVSLAKCHEIDADIRRLESNLWKLERRLLCHTSRVLVSAYHADKRRYNYLQTSDNSLSASTLKSELPIDHAKHQVAKSSQSEDFDDRSFYPPSNISDALESRQGSPITGASRPSLPAIRDREIEISDGPPNAKLSNGSWNLAAMDDMSTSGLLLDSQKSGLTSMKQKLVEINSMLQPFLAHLDSKASDNRVHDVKTRSFGDSSKEETNMNQAKVYSVTLEQEIATLEHSVFQLQTYLRNQMPMNSIKRAGNSDYIDLSSIWEILLNHEKNIREMNLGDGNSGFQAIRPGGSDLEANTFPAVSQDTIEEMAKKVKGLSENSLDLMVEKKRLQIQLVQEAHKNQLEIQKNENDKSNHEQQIIGLTNSLSNTMNELSQLQDVNTLHSNQEILKLRTELDEKERIYSRQTKELQMMTSQISQLESLLKDADEGGKRQEYGFQEKLHKVEEELFVKSNTLEENLAVIAALEKRDEDQQARISNLLVEVARSKAAILENENDSLRGKGNLECLEQELQAHKAHAETLEQDLHETALSQNMLEKRCREQSETIDTLQGIVSESQDQLQKKEAQQAEQILKIRQLESQLTQIQANKKDLEANISALESKVQVLSAEVAKLTENLEMTKSNSRQEIDDERQRATALIQAEEGRPQVALDTTLLMELESLSRQNEDLLNANVALQAKISEITIPESTWGSSEVDMLRGKCEKLQNELNELLIEYESLVKVSVGFEAERTRLELQSDVLQDKVEALESSLADEKIRWLGSGQSARSTGIQSNSIMTPLSSSGESMTMSVLRAEFKKMMRDMRSEHNKILRNEQESRRRLENELRQVRKEQQTKLLDQ